MLELREITAAYEVWQAAGLKPNWVSEDAKKAIERQTLERYKYTDIEMWGDTVDYIADNNKYWPTWADINNTLSILRQNKIGAEKKAIERNSKAANEFVKKLFADLAAGKTFGELRQPVSEKVRAAAKRIFPDADDSFIKRNYNDISFIADVERKCAECINTVDCPYSGHQPFLRVDKESGFTYVVADRERCYKYHPLVPDVVPKRSACRQGDLATDPSDVVIDPVAGSGTTLRAAMELGRNSYGFELSKEFYNKAKTEMLKPQKFEQLVCF